MTSTLETPPSRLHDPYPGPRPFHIEEQELFFGRDREREQLLSLVLAHSLVLMYAPSGAGKTSLLRASLLPALETRGAIAFPILRVRPSGLDSSFTHIPNVYVRSAAANWSAAHRERLPNIARLRDLLAFLREQYDVPPDEPRILIIDQFEEIFAMPEHWESRGEFFMQIQEALTADPDLRVLLVMREDYVPQVDPYAGLAANYLQHRLRIERLRREQALEAINGPLVSTDRSFAPGADEYLVDQLLQIRVERDGHTEDVMGEYVEPVQLQIVCAQLWERIRALEPPVTCITKDHIKRHAPIKHALARFYGDVIDRVATDTGFDSLRLRRWCEDVLITSGGTRALVYQSPTDTGGMSNEVINRLTEEHLIRGEERAGAHWYELAHDKFIEAIQSGNRFAFEQKFDVAVAGEAQADAWSKRVADAIDELRKGDRDSRVTSLQRLYPIVVASIPLPQDLVRELDYALSEVVADDRAEDEIRRQAEQLRFVLRRTERGLDYQLGLRASAAYVRRLRVKMPLLIMNVSMLAAGLLVSLAGLAALSGVVFEHWSIPNLGFGELLAISMLALIWAYVYAFETFDNFPLDSWRRSRYQHVHTLTAPLAPYRSRRGRLRGDSFRWLVGWPLSLVLPWFVAAGIGTLAVNLFGWSLAAVFYPVLAAGSLLAAWVYLYIEL